MELKTYQQRVIEAGKQFRYFMVFDNKPIEGAMRLGCWGSCDIHL